MYEALASRFSLSQGLSRVSLGLSSALNRLSLGPAAGRKSSLVQVRIAGAQPCRRRACGPSRF